MPLFSHMQKAGSLMLQLIYKLLDLLSTADFSLALGTSETSQVLLVGGMI